MPKGNREEIKEHLTYKKVMIVQPSPKKKAPHAFGKRKKKSRMIQKKSLMKTKVAGL